MSSSPLRLFNVSAIARFGGIAILTVQRRIESLGIEPAAMLNPIGRSPQPLFDEHSLCVITTPFLKARLDFTGYRRLSDGTLKKISHEPARAPNATDTEILYGLASGLVKDVPFANAKAEK